MEASGPGRRQRTDRSRTRGSPQRSSTSGAVRIDAEAKEQDETSKRDRARTDRKSISGRPASGSPSSPPSRGPGRPGARPGADPGLLLRGPGAQGQAPAASAATGAERTASGGGSLGGGNRSRCTGAAGTAVGPPIGCQDGGYPPEFRD